MMIMYEIYSYLLFLLEDGVKVINSILHKEYVKKKFLIYHRHNFPLSILDI